MNKNEASKNLLCAFVPMALELERTLSIRKILPCLESAYRCARRRARYCCAPAPLCDTF
jgi:hypothetical protein